MKKISNLGEFGLKNEKISKFKAWHEVLNDDLFGIDYNPSYIKVSVYGSKNQLH